MLFSSNKQQYVTFSNWLKGFVLALGLAFAPLANAAEQIIYYHFDALGSPVASSDATGNYYVWKETYQPYGERIQKQPNSDNNTRWYTGKPQDDETGLSYFGARYYDPVIGRFMGVDPKEFTESNPHSFNRYNYANNNPYKYVDPDGRSPLLLIPVFVGLFTLSDYVNAPAPGQTPVTMSTGERIGGVAGALLLGVGSGSRAAVEVGGSGPVLQGQRAVEKAVADLQQEGREVVGRNITIETSQGRRVTDLVTRGEGGLKGHEIKSGNSPYTPSQRAKDAEIGCSGGCGIGKKAQDAGLSGPVRFPTELRRYPAE